MSNHWTKCLHFSDGLEGSKFPICCRKCLSTSCKSFVLIGWISCSDSDPSSSIETSPIWWLLFSMPADSGNTKAAGCSETSPVWWLLFSVPSDSSNTKAARGCALTCMKLRKAVLAAKGLSMLIACAHVVCATKESGFGCQGAEPVWRWMPDTSAAKENFSCWPERQQAREGICRWP